MGGYFPNFLDTGLIIPHQNLEAKIDDDCPDYFNSEKFTLLHAGNLMSKRNPKGLIDGYNLFLQKNQRAKNKSNLLFLGPADYHKEYLEKELNENIFWSRGNVPYSEVSYVQKNASVNIILEAKSEISPFLPAKFTHCVIANKPIIILGPYYSEVKRLLKNDYPYYSEIDEAVKISSFINDLYQIWEKNKELLVLDREDLVHYVSEKHLLETINTIFV